MRTPFSKIHGTVFVDNVPHTSYYKITPCDAAAHLLTYQFDSEEATLPPNELVLSEGGFCDLGAAAVHARLRRLHVHRKCR